MNFFDDEVESQVAPLIVFEQNEYRVHEPTLKLLESIKKPLGVVACAGRYRTGKSYLLNCICDAPKGGFAVGDTVQACTKGIWMYKNPIDDTAERCVLVLDTEGIDALDAGDTHDVRIFTLALLLSGSFLYNSMGPIDETALQTLSLMTKISEFVRVQGEEGAVDAGALSEHMPTFYWILRDFNLRLETRDHVACSEDDYLEEALQDATTSEERCRVRRVVREAFPSRALITLPRPGNIDDNRDRGGANLRFQQEVRGLKSRLLRDVVPMTTNGRGVTGTMFAQLCRHYVSCLNRADAIPVVKDTWSMLAEAQGRDLMDNLFEEALKTMNRLEATHLEPTVLLTELDKIVAAMLAKLETGLMEPDPKLCERFEERVRGVAAAARARAEAAVQAQMEQVVQRIGVIFEETPMLHASLAQRVAQEQRELESRVQYQTSTCDALRSKLWQRLTTDWLPNCVQEHLDRVATLQGDLDKANSEKEELARSEAAAKEWAKKETERQVQEAIGKGEADRLALKLQIDGMKMQLDEETCAREQEVRQLMERLHEAESRSGERPSSPVAGDAADAYDRDDRDDHDGGDAHELQELKKRMYDLQMQLRANADELSELRAVRSTLMAQNEQNREARDSMERKWKEDLLALQTKHEEGIKRIRMTLEESEQRAVQDANEARTLEALAKRELAELRQQRASDESNFREQMACVSRELRAQCEGQMCARATCEDLQERIVVMHRETLEEVRNRDVQWRDAQRDHSRELIETQVQRGEALRLVERANNEVRELKRRLEGKDEAERSLKRLRQETEGERVAMNTEVERGRGRCEAIIAEREKLRNELMGAERKVNDLERELRLASASNTIS